MTLSVVQIPLLDVAPAELSVPAASIFALVPVGPTGPMGTPGLAGPIGPAGASGPAGLPGPTGPLGAQGPIGPTGPAGAAGLVGPTGPTGPGGAVGPQGPIGPVGPTGSQGAVGAAGAVGAIGAQGVPGPAYGGTSSTSLTVGTGTKTFVTQSGLAWVVGNVVRLASGAAYMEGAISAYTATSMTLNAVKFSGTGTLAAWVLGPPGGADGTGAVSSVNGQVGSVKIANTDALDVLRVSGTDLLAIVDAADNVLLNFKADGTLDAAGIAADVLIARKSLAVSGTTTEQVWGLGYAIVHSNDRVAFYVLDDGTTVTPGENLSPSRFVVDGIVASDKPLNQAVDWNIHLGSGQSLAAAGNDGTITYASSDKQAHAGASAVTALTNGGSYGVGLVAAEQAKFALKGEAARNLLASPLFADDYTQVFSSNAAPGQAIAYFQPGNASGAFTAHMAAIDTIITAATATGKVAQVPFLTWQQGETDIGSSTYKADLISLKNSYNTQALARTKQPNRFPVIYTQLAGHNSGSVPQVGRAQWEAFQDDGELILACPQYAFPYADGTHLTNAGYKWLGQMLGKIAYLVGVMGKPWKPLHPLSAKARTGNVVTLKMHVPSGSLVLDTTTIPAAAQMGFRVFDAAGEPAINSVSIINRDTVRLVLSRALSGAATVEYAWRDDPVNGGQGNYAGTGVHAIRGNIRDSDASKAAYTDAAYPLWNWLVRCSIAVTP